MVKSSLQNSIVCCSPPQISMVTVETTSVDTEISISLNFWLEINPVGSCYCIVVTSYNNCVRVFSILWCKVMSWSVP